MVKLVNESGNFDHDDFKDWNWLFFNNKESDCILYSEDGHEFRIHKEILSQTRDHYIQMDVTLKITFIKTRPTFKL